MIINLSFLKISILFFFACNLTYGQKSFGFEIGGGLFFHPVYCDTYINYNSTINSSSSNNNERVSFESHSTYTGLYTIQSNYSFNKHFFVSLGFYSHKIEEVWVGNPDTVIKYNTFWKNPSIAENTKLNEISFSSGFGYTYKSISLTFESMLFEIVRTQKTVEELYDGTQEINNNVNRKFQRLIVGVSYNVKLNNNLFIKPFIGWYNLFHKCPENYFSTEVRVYYKLNQK